MHIQSQQYCYQKTLSIVNVVPMLG